MSGELTSYGELAEVIRTLPNICHEMRRARGLSLRAAAKEAGVSFSSLLRFEDAEAGVNVSTLVAVMQWIDQTGADS